MDQLKEKYFTLIDNQLQLSSHLEDLNKNNDGKATNNHEEDLVMAYSTNTESSTLYPRIFYALYIGPKDNSISQVIFILSTKQTLTTINYQPIPVSENLFKTINEKDLFTTKIQIG